MLADGPSSAEARVPARACDRCRRRKAKCDSQVTRQPCSSCRDAHLQCTFNVPLGKRGPKPRRRLPAAGIPADTLHSPELAQHSPQAISRHSTPSWSRQSLSQSQRWYALQDTINGLDVAQTLETVARRAVRLYFDYVFPLIPLVDEPSVLGLLDCFVDASASLAQPTTADFTLLTALCAEVAFFVPKELFPEGDLVGPTFLNASRDCLASYAEADLENPNAASLAIRYFHSNCLHASAKPRLSWYVFGEATRIAQAMHLHDEAAYDGLPAVETELRRRAFWLLYLGDKSAATLNNRPIAIHKYSFEAGITTNHPASADDERLLGFIACIRLWKCASDLLLEIRLVSERHYLQGSSRTLSADDRLRLDYLHIAFATCPDDLPQHLQPASFNVVQPNDPARRTFLTQAANLQVTYHCLRLVILQKLEALGYFTEHADMLALRKTEIAHDFLRVIQEAPFWSLQVNGEPCVEKIRLVGANMLALIHTNEASPLAARARRDLVILIDILTRLDSKASDALRAGYSSEF